MFPVKSVYRWKGRVEADAEWIVQVKTTAGRAGSVRDRIRALHSYELPEVILLPILSGSREYLDWIGRETVSAVEE